VTHYAHFKPPPDAHEGWVNEGDALVRELMFRDNDTALAFADDLAARAVDYGRRPSIALRSYLMRLTVANVNHAGVTAAELRLAKKVNDIIAADPRPVPLPRPQVDRVAGRTALPLA
jgi:pterin-4a-carbinolamine dehydratase